MNSHIKKIVLLIILIVLLIISLSFSRLFKKTDNVTQNIIEIDSEVIVSESIMNTPQPNNGDKFWATMYRKDPATGKIYFVIDRLSNKLKEIKNVNKDTFEVLWSQDSVKFSYAKDVNGIYCNDKIDPKFDPATFIAPQLNYRYARDNKNVYLDCDIVQGADPKTFVELITMYKDGNVYSFSKDETHVYMNKIVLKDADPKTFAFGMSGYSYDDNNLYYLSDKIGSTKFTPAGDVSGTIVEIDSPKAVLFKGDQKNGVLNELSSKLNSKDLRLQVFKGIIYFVDNDGKISSYDLSKNKVQQLNIKGIESPSKDQAPNIVDFLLNKDNVYILYGNNCNQYMAKCDVELIKYNISANVVSTVADHLSVRNILGVDEIENSIYLNYSEGDAGCAWGKSSVLSLENGKVLRDFNLTYCSDDVDSKDKINKSKEFLKPVSEVQTYSDLIYIEKGKIVQPPKDANWEHGYVVYVRE